MTVVHETTGRRPDRRQGVSVAALLLLAGSVIPIPPRQNPDFGAFGPDKFLHALGHAGLAATLVAAFEDAGPPLGVAAFAIAVSTGYGIGTELLQVAIPGREFERGDVAAGLVGSVVGVWGWHRLA